jgi:hypothetical protein
MQLASHHHTRYSSHFTYTTPCLLTRIRVFFAAIAVMKKRLHVFLRILRDRWPGAMCTITPALAPWEVINRSRRFPSSPILQSDSLLYSWGILREDIPRSNGCLYFAPTHHHRSPRYFLQNSHHRGSGVLAIDSRVPYPYPPMFHEFHSSTRQAQQPSRAGGAPVDTRVWVIPRTFSSTYVGVARVQSRLRAQTPYTRSMMRV